MANIELANRIIDNNLHQNTKRQYSNKVKHLYEWFKEFHPELCMVVANTHKGFIFGIYNIVIKLGCLTIKSKIA